MTQKAINYGIVLYQLGISEDTVAQVEKLLADTPQLYTALASPAVSKADKRHVVDRVFGAFEDKLLVNYMKSLCDNDVFGEIDEVFVRYRKYAKERESVLVATLYYVTPPTDRQRKGIEDFLMKEYDMKSVELSLVEKKELIGGFVIQTGDREYDRSILGRYKSLKHKLVMR